MAPAAEDAERIRHLQSLTDAALAHLDLDDLLQALLLRITQTLGVETAAVLLVDEDERELAARAAVGLEEEVEQGVRIPVGRGFAGRVAAERRPVILDDVDHADVLDPILLAKGVKSLLGVPLVIRGAVIGVMHVGTLVHRKFAEADVELLQLAADRAAIAIDHARLYAAERAARTRLEHVQAVTDAALAHLALDDLLSVLLPRIREILAADTCAVLLLDDDGRELVARAAVGIEEEVEQGVRIPLGRGFAGRVAAERRPVMLDRVDASTVLNPILHEKGIKVLLGVPLVVGDHAIGVVHVGRLAQRPFVRPDVELLELVAGRVALAIERSRLHEEIVRLDQLKLNFVAIASHELRTPATTVYGALATLVERPDLPPEARDALLRAGYDQAERLRRLLEELLDLSRLDARGIAIAPKPLVLRSVLLEIAAGAVGDADAVTIDVDPDFAIVADPLVLERVVSNLVANANRYGRPPIVVEAAQRDRHVRIAVEDAGGGVPRALEPRLFERFARGDDGGSGLGLAIARAYARAHGGDVVYAPRGRGARFELILPR